MLQCWEPSKHRGLAKPHSKGYDYTQVCRAAWDMHGCCPLPGLGLFQPCPVGSALRAPCRSKDMSFLGDPGTPWNPQWIVGEGRGGLFILSSEVSPHHFQPGVLQG